jgi:uncharacterized protein YidB (DUF937 family)
VNQEQMMGLFDSVLGAATQAAGSALGQSLGQTGLPGGASPDALMQGLAGLLSGSGGSGLAGLVSQFQQGGLGEVVSSWISTGANQQAAGQLSHWLPQVVDGLTPDGQLPDGEPDMSGLLPQLLGGLFQR